MKNHFVTFLGIIICLCSVNAIADSASMFATFRELLKNEEMTDLTLIAKDGSELYCHRVILAARNKYWKNILTIGMKETLNSVIKLPYKKSTIETFVSYIYQPDTNILNQPILLDKYMELITLASLTVDDNLKKDLTRVKITSNGIQKKDWIVVLQFAILHDDENLIHYIFNNIENESVNKALSKQIIKLVKKGNFKIILALMQRENSKLYKRISKINTSLFATMSSKQILNMANWSKSEAEDILRNYILVEEKLLNNLEWSAISAAKDDQSNPAKTLSFFLSYYEAYISLGSYASHDAAYYAACHAANKAAGQTSMWGDVYYKAHRAAARKYILMKDWLDARKSMARAAYQANPCAKMALEKFTSKSEMFAQYVVKKATQDSVMSVLIKLKLSSPEEFAKLGHQLANLYVLAYIAEPNFRNQYFQPAYKMALNTLKSDPQFKLSASEIVHIIADNTWLKSHKLARNPFIISLKAVMETFIK